MKSRCFTQLSFCWAILCSAMLFAGEVPFSQIGSTDKSSNTGVGTHWLSAAISASNWKFVSRNKGGSVDGTWTSDSDTNKTASFTISRNPGTFTMSISGTAKPTSGSGTEPVYSNFSVNKSVTLAYDVNPNPITAVSIGETSEKINFRENGTSIEAYWKAVKSGSSGDFGTTLIKDYYFCNNIFGEYTVSAKRDNATASSEIKNIQVKSVHYDGVTSITATPGEDETVYVVLGDEDITINATPEPGNDWPSTKPIWQKGTSDEARETSFDFTPETIGAVSISVGYLDSDTRKIIINVCNIDLRLDSNNDGGIDSEADSTKNKDELVEDNAPGKIVSINNLDTDNDGIPNFADGYDSSYGTSAPNSSAAFTPLQITIPKYLDVDKLNIKLEYSVSDPTSITRSGSGTETSPYIYTPASGALRLWTSDGNTARKKASIATKNTEDNTDTAGYFIPSNSNIPLKKLFTGTKPTTGETWTVTVYIEAVNVSSAVGGTTVKATLVHEGQATPNIVSDTVKLTVFSVTPKCPVMYTLCGHNNDNVELECLPTGMVYLWSISTENLGAFDSTENNKVTWHSTNSGTGNISLKLYNIDVYTKPIEIISVSPRSSWGAASFVGGDMSGGMDAINAITVHHAGSSQRDDTAASVLGIQSLHISNGYGDISYHFILMRSGTFYEGRTLEGIFPNTSIPCNNNNIGPYTRGAHVASNNTAAGIGVLVLGNFGSGGDTFSTTIQGNLEKVLTGLCRRYNKDQSALKYHQMFNSGTECPGAQIIDKFLEIKYHVKVNLN